jgi:hypothetical protein
MVQFCVSGIAKGRPGGALFVIEEGRASSDDALVASRGRFFNKKNV